MPEENAELARRVMTALNDRDIDRFLSHFDRDVEFIPLIVQMEGGEPYRGHEGMRVWWTNILGIFPAFSAQTDEITDVGDVTFARLHLRGRGAGSDAPIDQRAWSVMQWRNEKTVWWRVFRNEAEARDTAEDRGRPITD